MCLNVTVYMANSVDPDLHILIWVYSVSVIFFLPASPASYTNNLVSWTHKIYTCESLNSQNTKEHNSKYVKDSCFYPGTH